MPLCSTSRSLPPPCRRPRWGRPADRISRSRRNTPAPQYRHRATGSESPASTRGERRARPGSPYRNRSERSQCAGSPSCRRSPSRQPSRAPRCARHAAPNIHGVLQAHPADADNTDSDILHDDFLPRLVMSRLYHILFLLREQYPSSIFKFPHISFNLFLVYKSIFCYIRINHYPCHPTRSIAPKRVFSRRKITAKRRTP